MDSGFNGIRIYAAASSQTRSRRTCAGLRYAYFSSIHCSWYIDQYTRLVPDRPSVKSPEIPSVRNNGSIRLSLAAFLLVGYFVGVFALLSVLDAEAFRPIAGVTNRPPLAFLLNQTCLRLFGGTAAVYYAHALLGVATFFVGFLVINKVSDRAVNSSVSVVFTLLLLSHLLWQEEIIGANDTTLFGLLLMLFFWALLSDFSLSTKAILMGVFAGLGWLTRATGVVCFPLLLLGLFTVPSREPLRSRVSGMALCLIAFTLVTAPWQANIFTRTKTFSLSPYPGNGLRNLVKGNNRLAMEIYPYIDIDSIQELIEEHYADERGNYHLSSVYDDAVNDPTAFFVHQLKKSTLFFLPIQSPFGSAKTEFRDGHVHVSDFRAHHIYRDFFVLLNFFPLFGFALFVGYALRAGASKPRRQLPISDGSCWLRPESTSCSTSAFGLKLGLSYPCTPSGSLAEPSGVQRLFCQGSGIGFRLGEAHRSRMSHAVGGLQISMNHSP